MVHTNAWTVAPHGPLTSLKKDKRRIDFHHPQKQYSHSSGLRGTAKEDTGMCLPGKDHGWLSQKDLRADKATVPPTFQEIILRTESPKGCLLPKETYSPRCVSTYLTLDFDSLLLCIWAPLRSNREKQAYLHSHHPPDTYVRRCDEPQKCPEGSNQCFF